jgi:putative ABC transport system permease protein
LSIFGYFAVLIVIISAMGLLGLASFTAEQRTKEIGIRKILGSTQNQITSQLVKEFLILILISGAIALPLSYWLMSKWLDAFANRIGLSWTYFAFSLLGAMAIALLTVIFQAIKAARSNPVDVLKYE